jgi:indole-3-glycerol phosphate synthase
VIESNDYETFQLLSVFRLPLSRTGSTGVTTMLTTLIEAAERQTERRRAAIPEPDTDTAPPPRDFAAALAEPGLSVIAELKPRSPSKGTLTCDYQPARLARSYRKAHAVSVLTHEEGFGGTPEHLGIVRAEVEVPVLRKDFIVDEYQIREARALGADAVLLIVGALRPERLAQLIDTTQALGMAALVEVHDAGEVDVALNAGAEIVGVNHRDLKDFQIDRSLSARLRGRIGSRRLMVAESGVRDARDAAWLRAAGADAILVGELLMRAEDPAVVLEELIRV